MGRWEVRDRRGSVTIESRRYQPAPEPPPASPVGEALATTEEGYVVIAVRRGARVFPMSSAVTPKEGDVATVAVHEVEGEDARRRLEALGWQPAAETEPGAAASEQEHPQASAT